MQSYDEYGLTQRLMARLATVNPSTINRYIAEHSIESIPSSAQKRLRFSPKNTRKILNEFIKSRHPISGRKKVQSYYNFKGGTGKTSVCFQVSTMLALCGYEVLVVDADPQGHLSTSLGYDTSQNYFTLYDLIIKDIPFNETVKNIFEGLDCIPSNLSLTRLETSLNEQPKREERLKLSLAPYCDRYDFIFFDANPTISHLNRNVLTCSDVVNIVCETQPYSLNGLKLLMEDITRFYKSMALEKPEIMIIPNKYEDRLGSSAEAMAALRKYYLDYVMKDFAIRKSEDINTAAKLRMPIGFFCKSNSNAFEDFKDLALEIIKKSEAVEKPEIKFG